MSVDNVVLQGCMMCRLIGRCQHLRETSLRDITTQKIINIPTAMRISYLICLLLQSHKQLF